MTNLVVEGDRGAHYAVGIAPNNEATVLGGHTQMENDAVSDGANTGISQVKPHLSGAFSTTAVLAPFRSEAP